MMLNDLLVIILSASCAVLLFYYLRPRGNSRSASLLIVPKTETVHESAQTLLPAFMALQGKLALPVPQSTATYTTKSTPLPPLNLLKRTRAQSQSQIGAHAQAHLITETLAAFDIPATVVEINQGPTITQFGLQPGVYEKKKQNGHIQRRKVKVSAITALTNDLALALSAKSLRIYPVPGKPYLALEIPNPARQLVTLTFTHNYIVYYHFLYKI